MSTRSEALERAFSNGDPEAAHRLGVLHRENGEHGLAEHWFRRAVEAGVDASLVSLGVYELQGGTPRKGLERLERAAKTPGLAERFDAILVVADAYYRGWLVAEDRQQAFTWWRFAAMLGNAASIEILEERSLSASGTPIEEYDVSHSIPLAWRETL